MKKQTLLLLACLAGLLQIDAQPLLETWVAKMPSPWIDKNSRHTVLQQANNGHSNLSFYFHIVKSAYFNMIYRAKLPCTFFTIV